MRNHVFANNLKEGLLKLMALAWTSSQTWWQTTNHNQSLATSSLSFPPPLSTWKWQDEASYLDILGSCKLALLARSTSSLCISKPWDLMWPPFFHAKLRARPARGIPHIGSVGTWRRQSKKWCWSHWRGSKYLLCQTSRLEIHPIRHRVFVLFFGPGHGDSRTKGNFKECISCFKSYAKIVDHFDPFWDQKTQHILDQKGLYV